MTTVLTIAGFDPSSGAGVTADLAVFAAHGLFGTSCITALTVQSTLGVRASHSVDPAVIEETLDCLADDLPPFGIKIGMLATARSVEAVAEFLERQRALRPSLIVVLDPVLRSTSSRELLDEKGIRRMQERLLPLVDWCTPNLDELSALTAMPVSDRTEMLIAGLTLRRRFQRWSLIVTGGHLQPPDDLVLAAGSDALWLPGTKIDSRATHGTGCAFSSALLCGLVNGLNGADAARAAKAYVAEGIRRAMPIGGGKGPLNLLWKL